MNVEFAALVVGVFLFVAVLTWDEIRVWNRMRASEVASNKMQEEIKALRRLLMERGEYPKAEASKIDARDTPVEIRGGEADVYLTPLNWVSTESHTWMRPLQLRLRYSFSGMSIFSFPGMSVFLIVSTIAATLIYIFVFKPSASELDIAILSTADSVDSQPAVPASPQALPSMGEREDILASTQAGVEGEVRTPSPQTIRRSNARSNESDFSRPAPHELESRTSESRMTEEKGGAMSGVRPDDSDALYLYEDQESSPPTMNLAIESTTTPVDTPAVIRAPLPHLVHPTEARGLGVRTEAESEVQTPSTEATRRSESKQKESDGAALQPTPEPESRTSESRMTATEAKPSFEVSSPAAVAMPPPNPVFESAKPPIDRPGEPPQPLVRPQEPTDQQITLEESAPQIVPDLLQPVPLPRASPKTRLRSAKPKLTVVSVGTQAPAASIEKPPVASAPVTPAPAVGPKPPVGSVSAQAPAASNWLRRLFDLGNQE